MFIYDLSKVSSLNRKMQGWLLLITLAGALTKSPHLVSSFPKPFWLWNTLHASCSHHATPTPYPANFLPYPKLKLKLIPSVALIRVGGPVGKWVCREKSSPMDRLFISKRDDETEVGLLLSLRGFYLSRTDYFFLIPSVMWGCKHNKHKISPNIGVKPESIGTLIMDFPVFGYMKINPNYLQSMQAQLSCYISTNRLRCILLSRHCPANQSSSAKEALAKVIARTWVYSQLSPLCGRSFVCI